MINKLINIWIAVGVLTTAAFTNVIANPGKSTATVIPAPSGYSIGSSVTADFDGDGKVDTAYVVKPPLLESQDDLTENSKQKPVIIYIKRGNGSVWKDAMTHYYQFPLFTAIDVTGDKHPDLLFAKQTPFSLLENKTYYAISFQKGRFKNILGDGSDKYLFDYVLVTHDKRGPYMIGVNFDWYEGEGADKNTPLYWYGDFFRWNGNHMSYYMTRKTESKYSDRSKAIAALKNDTLSVKIPRRAKDDVKRQWQ